MVTGIQDSKHLSVLADILKMVYICRKLKKSKFRGICEHLRVLKTYMMTPEGTKYYAMDLKPTIFTIGALLMHMREVDSPYQLHQQLCKSRSSWGVKTGWCSRFLAPYP